MSTRFAISTHGGLFAGAPIRRSQRRGVPHELMTHSGTRFVAIVRKMLSGSRHSLAALSIRHIRELPETWRKAEGGNPCHLVAGSLFDRIDVLGMREATVHLSEHAVRRGLAAALPAEVGVSVSGRSERSQAQAIRATVLIVSQLARTAWPA